MFKFLVIFLRKIYFSLLATEIYMAMFVFLFVLVFFFNLKEHICINILICKLNLSLSVPFFFILEVIYFFPFNITLFPSPLPQ